MILYDRKIEYLKSLGRLITDKPYSFPGFVLKIKGRKGIAIEYTLLVPFSC